MKYGKAINLIRRSKGLTQSALAKKIKTTPGFISLVEKGERSPSLENLKALADALNVPLYLLVLLASGKGELKGISEEQANVLGTKLLNMLWDK